MQDGASISGEEASAWLQEHFAGDPAPQISITWEPDTNADPGAYERLLGILFAPAAGDQAA
jgi:hypothetical protein